MRRRSQSISSTKLFKLLGVRRGRYWLSAVLVLSIAAVNALTPPAEPVSTSSVFGRVVKVADGDTVTVVSQDGLKLKIRLLGIDAPETQQAHGHAAKDWLTKTTLGKSIAVDITDTDRYGRKVGKLLAQDEDCVQENCPYDVDVNLRLIKLGHAWWYEAYQNNQTMVDRTLYKNAQNTARQSRLGLWNAANPTEPWAWRKQQREQRNK